MSDIGILYFKMFQINLVTWKYLKSTIVLAKMSLLTKEVYSKNLCLLNSNCFHAFVYNIQNSHLSNLKSNQAEKKM